MDASSYKPGDRIRLVCMDDQYVSHIPTNLTGTVTGVCPKPINVLNVEWDGDFHLNPCLDVDIVQRLN